ncbi:ABC transporter permease [Micromonospora sp. HM5-17]|uniref:ABC transporter permease n=1 Tax=Micromonospora sp. HM5-17 TaxID=2487710 RepID=UPI000F462865|nr:ABC transporter permease [Micromonospora sp. HM5-17]ROT32557.1 ABC transporter permease [Micromonospora sp. HM5-17]
MVEIESRARAPRTRWGSAPAVSAAVWPVIGLVALVAAWWLATSATSLVHPAVLPPPGEVLAAFLHRPEELLTGTWITTRETVLGFLLATAGGVLLGIALATSRTTDRMFSPLLVALNAVPKITFAPLLVIALDYGQKPILTMVVLLSFFPVVLATTTGLTSTPNDLVELTRSLDASRWQTFVKVRFPIALPQMFVGLKVAMPLAAIGAVIGEFYAGDEGGLGYAILQYSGVADGATAWAAILLVGILSIILYYALVLVERLMLPWVRETTSAR